MLQAINIISFDVPYPANYGGVIDVFYKLKALHETGVKIILHCFEYGRGEQQELNRYCEEVYYYKRNTSLFNHFSKLPYIVKSRQSEELLLNLKKNNFPILFEGLHTCSLLSDPAIKSRFTIFRESNIEHEYYAHLAKAENNFFRKIYFKWEANKLKRFEAVVQKSSLMLIVSKEDTAYFKKQYPNNKVEYLPSFHANNALSCKTGKGEYILYHGNLTVSENLVAAEFLIKDVFSKINFPVRIAGLNPPIQLQQLISKYKHIQLISNPPDAEMQNLIADAHINCLYTHQATGLKLKLLNVLYSGRFCVCNANMIHGTGLSDACESANSSSEMIEKLNWLFTKEFSDPEIEKRKNLLKENYNNDRKIKKLLELIS